MSEIDVIAWEEAGVTTEGAPITIKGLNPWHHDWIRLDAPQVVLPHPTYPHEQHTFDVYAMAENNTRVIFAATELSNGVYGFYTPKDK